VGAHHSWVGGIIICGGVIVVCGGFIFIREGGVLGEGQSYRVVQQLWCGGRLSSIVDSGGGGGGAQWVLIACYCSCVVGGAGWLSVIVGGG
jgi:hypothetical protein